MPTKTRLSIAEELLDDAQLARLEVLGAAESLSLLRGEIEHLAFVTGDRRMSHYADQMDRHLRVQRAGLTEVFVALRDLRETPGFKRASKERAWDGHSDRRRYDRRTAQREARAEIAAALVEDVAA